MGRGLKEESGDPNSHGTESREAFFIDFARETRKRFPRLILLLTGGFRTRKGIEAALKGDVCDLVGIGRPAVLRPDFPRLVMDDVYSDQEAKVVFRKVPVPFLARLLQIRILGGGAETVSLIIFFGNGSILTWHNIAILPEPDSPDSCWSCNICTIAPSFG